MNINFRNYVQKAGSIRFNLTLCKSTIYALSAIKNNNAEAAVTVGLFEGGAVSLEVRGLITRNKRAKTFQGMFALTKEGHLVYDLIKNAGFYERYEKIYIQGDEDGQA